jgi:hypothetical protein
MALPVDSVRTQVPVYQEPPSVATPSNPDPAETAERILDVGSQGGTDDYDARLDALADELGRGDNIYREQLMAEIFKQDPNALGSWLQPDRANRLQSEGRISLDQKGALAEGLAAAYNNGDIPQFEIGVGPIPGDGNEGTAQMSELENGLLSGFYTNSGLGPGPDTLQNAQNLREFIDFFNASDGPETAAFRESFGKHLIDQYVLNPAVGYNNPSQRDAAALLASNILSFDNNRPEIAADVLQNYDGEQIKTILEAAARGHSNLGEDGIRGLAESEGIDPDDASVYDGGALLIGAVNLADNAASDEVALDIARLARSAPDIFEGEQGSARLDSLTLLATRHSDAILGALTELDLTNIQGRSDTNNLQYKENTQDLSALIRLTTMNPDSTYSAMFQDKLTEYASSLTTTMNSDPQANPDEIGRLAILQASLSNAITQGYDEINADAAKREEFIGFAVDLVLSAVPVGKLTTDKIETLIKGAFPNATVQEALNGLSGQIVDSATGQLTDAAKQAIIDSVGVDEASMEFAKETVNGFVETVQSQLTDPADQAIFNATYIAVYDSVSGG